VHSQRAHGRNQEHREDHKVDENGVSCEAAWRPEQTVGGHPLRGTDLYCTVVIFMCLLRGFSVQAWTNQITGADQDLETLDVSNFPAKNLFVVMTTDKGLCGGVNTILSRMTRSAIAKLDAQGKKVDLYVCGEKGRAQMRRAYGDRFIASATDRQMPYTFELATSMSQDVLEGEYDAVHILYNRFKSAIVYIPSIKSITPLLNPADPFLFKYEVEPDNDPETLQNFYEYTLATKMFHGLLDNATSEQSSRMSAMENASKNAGEMLGKLNLQYNRARQARITTELIEIISGASALKG
jgi:F-type H+-transporting ATPase subunit gamma